MTKPRIPQTDDEWRHVATLAEAMLDIDAVRSYGLISGGPTVDTDRCRELLALAQARGIVPTSEAVNEMTTRLVRELCTR